ncbi:MAG TPA: HAD family phosphatase [Planctomycetaceae bacterium]|uniref:HAD family hydrolase n=1 Tax=Gimesia maris TaxID=122 RepID=UPI000E909B03|nr:HAD family phosphatase [Gimesia maris]QDU14482.1 Phosphorylated carbohydrates phosphatase [Gimesia maris]HAW28886.1 HAD family phosphatase [Planctomycetaceae bacterium]|tara:strand:+ start:1796 stop:2467 length:672 start_codon:yes stop_codon:yes gene_type:complete
MSDHLPIQAVAFDLDGLMFNTEHVFFLSGDALLQRRGKTMTPDILRGMMGRRALEGFEHLSSHLEKPEDPHELWLESQEIFRSLLQEHLKPMKGLFELLDYLEELDIPKCVATSSPRPYLETLLVQFDLTHRFPISLTAEDVTHGKPHPEIYLTAAEKMSVTPERMLVLEDSETGTKSGVGAGAYVVSIPHEYSNYGDFSSAQFIADSLTDARVLDLFSPQHS